MRTAMTGALNRLARREKDQSLIRRSEIRIRTVTGLRNVTLTLTGPAVNAKLVLVAVKLAAVCLANVVLGGGTPPMIWNGVLSTTTILVHDVCCK